MRVSTSQILAVAAVFWGTAYAACTSNLVIDDYSTYSTNINKQGSWTSDDGSMASITANTAAKKLTFTPKANAYFYESFDSCIAATTQGYNAITFPFKSPASGASFTLEIQTASTCASTTYTSYFYTVSGLTGATQTLTIPLSSFTGANLNVIKSFVWSAFSSNTAGWELGETKLACAAGTGSSSSATVTPTGTSSSTSVTVTSPTVTSSTPTTSGTCSPLVVDDWASQSRLTFLYYNAMLKASSDDGTMTSIVVANNRVTFTPTGNSYFYTNLDCTSATNKYGGIGMRIKAAAGTTFTVQMQYSASCSASNFQSVDRTTAQLGWTFDGTEKFYSFPLSTFTGLDTGHLMSIMFYNYNSKPVTLGPLAFYCGSTAKEYVVAPTPTDSVATNTVPATSATATAFVIDQFTGPDSNALGFWHGGDDTTGYTISGGKLTISYKDSDLAWYTQISDSCRDMTTYANGYLHIAYTGSSAFSIAFQQHNSGCNANVAPYPETWDEVDAGRYATATDIYVPIAHFDIIKTRTIGFALKGFTGSTNTVISKIEIVKTIPSGVTVRSKLPTAPLVFSCSVPNSLAFAIDDGDPQLAQQVMQIVKEENIKVTFFTVGAALLDTSTNLTNVYKEMMAQGHQVAYHSFTHPKIEGLGTNEAIDWEIQQDIDAVTKTLGITSKYFRPPFGNEGAKMRQRIAALIPGGKLINWSIDCEDWLYATSSTPEKQLDAFKRDLAKGGNLVVMHYLYPSTVGYLKQFIQLAKASGKNLMRVDQCLGDPNAPAL
ncbi:uncharacterized protein H6S33_005331 [Morchella sextelata]|uniref:uncharacterized protein n=1 Tax=Morchella sextelata TaxID=1174677 RepID=UPI001D05632D|nr:uncharacterized protein H6S33_005331 [Morchella sextelata]KAH0613445.1 hypothetical protein H6S33_005331 [Morchella sextelata]